MSIHNLCFGAKIRKIVTPRHTPVLLYKSGVYGGIYYMDLFFQMVSCVHGLHQLNLVQGGKYSLRKHAHAI